MNEKVTDQARGMFEKVTGYGFLSSFLLGVWGWGVILVLVTSVGWDLRYVICGSADGVY